MRYIINSLGCFVLLLVIQVLSFSDATAQWTNRYEKLSDFGHHVYLEEHELPVFAHGPTDPAPAPDGIHIAIAAQGWIWNLNIETGTATRLTQSSGTDSRPRWSPDGTHLAFVRDEGRNTAIIVLNMTSMEETRIDTKSIELDPEFSSDGQYLYYSSGLSGSMDLRRRHLATGTDETLTSLRQVERNPRQLNDGTSLLYLHGSGAYRSLRIRNTESGVDSVAFSQTLTYHLTADAHPTLPLIVYSSPIDNDYHLYVMDLTDSRAKHRITDGSPYALTPAFSADGESIFYVQQDEHRQFRLMRIRTYGGVPEEIKISRWELGEANGLLEIITTDATGDPVTARVSVTHEDGHPIATHEDATFFDPQTGRHYFYVEGSVVMSVPVGTYTVTVARGPMAMVSNSRVQVTSDQQGTVSTTITPIWDATAAGYTSADHHVHLNGDGHHRATHEDALRAMEGEDLNVLAPMSWNRWERRIDAPLLGKITSSSNRIVVQGQEVRSHFHGHVSVMGTDKAYAPWFWGPTNPTLGDPDRSNGEVLEFADRLNAFVTYVHPIQMDEDPFEHLDEGSIPLELIADAVLADQIGLEMVCAWTSPMGNSHVWYRLLNVGKPVAAMSGTDMWVDFHRTMAVGTGRNYVRVDGTEITAESVLEASIAGKGFVTTGPALLFEIGNGIKPGGIVNAGRQNWQATLAATNDIDTVELIVNGSVVETFAGIQAGETRTYTGQVQLPAGGWVAMRAYSSQQIEDSWPTMHARPFAHSSPVWIGTKGSVDPAARSAAASDLIRAIDASERIAKEAYGDIEMNRMMRRFDTARQILRLMVD